MSEMAAKLDKRDKEKSQRVGKWVSPLRRKSPPEIADNSDGDDAGSLDSKFEMAISSSVRRGKDPSPLRHQIEFQPPRHCIVYGNQKFVLEFRQR